VIIPCFNAAGFLPEAVASIRAQHYEPLEILIVDDGSTDNTAQAASRLGSGIRYFHKENGGPAAARNFGLREARGEWIALLDADDQWPGNKLDLQAGRLAEDSTIDVVTGRIRYIELPGAQKLDVQFEEGGQMAYIHLGAALYRRQAFEVVGLFNEALRFSEDHDWFLRAREAGLKIVILREVTLLYRLHGSNMTRGKDARDFMMPQVLHESLARRRKRNGVAAELPAWSSFDEKRRTDG
jgi:glycosyltransferase involved in cell wall biosynthesis